MKAFKSIIDFQAHFNNDEKCRQELEQERWGDTPYCPFCASINVCRFSTGKLFKCREKECRQKFTVTVGTIYESSKIPLTKWFLAQYLLTIHSKGISSLQLANFLGITQKSAWYLTHRIRESFKVLAPEQLENIVEFDETYIGGSLSNKHKSKRTAKGGTTHKEMVFGALQRGGKLITKVIPQTEIYQIGETIEQILAPDSTMVTDEHHAYKKIGLKYNHRLINHRAKEYVREEDILVHTNSIEGYWNLLKKQIDGIHHFVSPKHLQRYCNESAFRYNNRTTTQDQRFSLALQNINGNLPYKTLIGKI